MVALAKRSDGLMMSLVVMMKRGSDHFGSLSNLLFGQDKGHAVIKHHVLWKMVKVRRGRQSMLGHALLFAHLLFPSLLFLLFVTLPLSFVVLSAAMFSFDLLDLWMSALVLGGAGIERRASHSAVAVALLLPLMALTTAHGAAPLLGRTVFVGIVRRAVQPHLIG